MHHNYTENTSVTFKYKSELLTCSAWTGWHYLSNTISSTLLHVPQYILCGQAMLKPSSALLHFLGLLSVIVSPKNNTGPSSALGSQQNVFPSEKPILTALYEI